MAAGLGFKTFNTGDVLSAADVNGYLMQGVLVFASTAARDAAITAPAEGQFAFTKDTNSLFYYDGAAWVASGATGDIEGVTAGTGISGGGTSGTVTITNSMATAIDAKGDLIVGTGADTFSKLTAGTNGYLLTADSTEATGLKWAASAGGGGKILQVVQTTRAVDQSVNSATFTDITSLSVSITPSAASSRVYVIANIGGSYSYMYSTGTDSLSNWRVMRDSTEIIRAQVGVQYFPSSSDKAVYAPTTMSIVDSPATTSAVTYKVQCRGLSANTLAGNINTGDAGPATIIVWEIGA